MGFSSRYLRIPRPETFLYVMSLETGASLITLSLLLNKISGLYGLLALLTGYHLSPVQLSMYLYSLIALALTAILFPHIRKQSPFECLALAWLYLLDSLINAAFTATFGVTWFLVVSQRYEGGKVSGPGSDTIAETAGFTSPKYDAAYVEIQNTKNGNNFIAHPPRSVDPLSNAVDQPESFQSIIFICVLWLVRVYFVLVMLAFARQTLRLWMVTPRHTQLPTHSRNVSIASVANIDREPFSPISPEGQGWKGKLARVMVGIGRSYWLGEEEEGNWLGNLGQKLRNRQNHASPTNELPGPLERERRRRSGTGPPQPSPSIVRGAQFPQTIPEHAPGMNVKMQDWNEPR
ncbi:Kei1 family protein [Penicillium ucsense]|uniref:Kei1 family protein n=1 Tax=Penicillium ucsense TaxID=2839758 RepID=A0A8J8WHN3_9EURO|nr:Kei1 family protein [Penicillium ucsense]KAF7734293.1 Kei1 family protein [Penicillium ucsense]